VEQTLREASVASSQGFKALDARLHGASFTGNLLQLNLCQVPALGLFHPSQVPLVLPGGLPPRVGQREVEQRHLRLAVLGLCVLVRLRGLFCFWGNLPSRVTVLPHVHLSKAADIANPDHVDCEVAEEINDLLSSVTESKDEDERGDNRRQQLVKEEERRVTEELVQFCHHLVSVGLTSPLQGEVVDVSDHLCECLLWTKDQVLIGDEDSCTGHSSAKDGHDGEQVFHVEHVLVPHREHDRHRQHRATDEGNILSNHRGERAEYWGLLLFEAWQATEAF